MLLESLVSRPVHVRCYPQVQRKAVDLEDVGGKRSAKAQYRRGRHDVESRGLPIKGLRRYLDSRVGHNWDQVLSDLRTLARKDALYAMREEFDWLVVSKTFLGQDGTVFGRSDMCEAEIGDMHQPFYVDPVTRKLLRIKRKPARASFYQTRQQHAGRVELPDGALALRLNGIWYRVELAPIPAEYDWYHDPKRDAVFNRELRHVYLLDLRGIYGRGDVYATHKSQLSAKDIARFGLTA